MGKRSRKDPEGHAERGKGEPTSGAPQNQQPIELPGPHLRLFMEDAHVRHVPEGPGGVPCEVLSFVSGTLTVDVVFPVEVALALTQLVTEGMEPLKPKQDGPARSEGGVILPDGTRETDPDQLAQTLDQLTGDTKG